MTEEALLALLAHLDAKIALAIAQSKSHIKQVPSERYEDSEKTFQNLWNTMKFQNNAEINN